MRYDDQARRFNFLSGLLFGAALAAGMTMMVTATQERFPARALRRRLG